jgi:ubiquitin-protein ligase E3 C
MKSFGGHARERPRVNMGGQRGLPQSREEVLRRAEASRLERERQRRKVHAAHVLQQYYRAHRARTEAMDELRHHFDSLSSSSTDDAYPFKIRLVAFFFNVDRDIHRLLQLSPITKSQACFDGCQQSLTNAVKRSNRAYDVATRLVMAADLSFPHLDTAQHYQLVYMLWSWQCERRLDRDDAQSMLQALFGKELDRISRDPRDPLNQALLERIPTWFMWAETGDLSSSPALFFDEHILSQPFARKVPGLLSADTLGFARIVSLCKLRNKHGTADQTLPYPFLSLVRRRSRSESAYKLLNYAQLMLDHVLLRDTTATSHSDSPIWSTRYEGLHRRESYEDCGEDSHPTDAWTLGLAELVADALTPDSDDSVDPDTLDDHETSAAWLDEHVLPEIKQLLQFLTSPVMTKILLGYMRHGGALGKNAETLLIALVEFWPAERDQLLTQLAMYCLANSVFFKNLFDCAQTNLITRIVDVNPERALLFEICYRIYMTMPDRDFFNQERNPLQLDDLWRLAQKLNLAVLEAARKVEPVPEAWQPRAALVSRLLNHLVVRYARSSNPDPAKWVLSNFSDLERVARSVLRQAAEDADSDEEMDEDGASKKRNLEPGLKIVMQCPWILGFEYRLRLLQQLIADDAERSGFNDYRHRVSRFPVEVRREHEFEDGFEVLWPVSSAIKQPLSIHYRDVFGMEEAGIDGGGLTKEFLLEACKQAFHPDSGLFEETEDRQLHPTPTASARTNAALQKYEFLGRIVGKCVYEGILIDASFASFFLQKWIGKMSYLDDLQALDKDLYYGLLKLKDYTGDVEQDFALDFTITESSASGTTTVNLIPKGSETSVTRTNRLQYIHLVCHYKLNVRYRKQADAFVRGLAAVLNPRWLAMFSTSELQALIGGNPVPIDVKDLKNNTEYGDYAADDTTVRLFWECLEHRFNEQERRLLVKFVTSTPRPPLLGFRMLSPRFCIRQAGADAERLPTASTCVNLLKLPAYPDAQTMESKLRMAITGHAGFDLS